MGWILLVLISIMSVMGYKIYQEETRPVEVKQAQEQRRKDSIVDSFEERCVNDVSYYFTDGAHNVRFAPVVDAETLTFKRCK